MSIDYLDGGFSEGEIVAISSARNVGKSKVNSKEVLRAELRHLVRGGPLPWDQFQRLASAAYGTGAVGSMQDFYAVSP